ncbi:hypothetical protein G6F22_015658 [Rhizopus arrhizus]|nr:hypothetical protein G6F22_015658 [Rhizopus arrhizus]
METRGYRSAVTTPILAVSAASRRSAARTSGRRDRGRCREGAGLRGEVLGRSAGEQGEPEQLGLALGNDPGNVGSPLLPKRRDTRGVERSCQAGVLPAARHADRAVQQLDDLPRHGQTVRGAGGSQIRAGRRRYGRYPHGVQLGLCRLVVAPRGFDVPLYAAEKVYLVRDGQARIDNGILAIDAGRGLDGGLPLAVHACGDLSAGQPIGGRLANLSSTGSW